jgi:hypothetical protein
MPCTQSATNAGGAPAFSGPFTTEADCINRCAEGACCDGTACTVRRQCECLKLGHVFQGVGTTCSPNPCGPAPAPPPPPPSQADAVEDVPTSGPGTELKKILARVGIVATDSCPCNARAAEMDRQGCDWVESNISTVVGWLREQAHARGLPFLDAAGRALVRVAVRNARRAAMTPDGSSAPPAGGS